MPELSIHQAFDLAQQTHRAGRLEEAEKIYRQILAQKPDHAGSLHYLGFMANQRGRNDLAAQLIRRAIAIDPDYANAHYNLGNALKAGGKPAEAAEAYRQAIRCNPDFPEAYNNLGSLMHDAGKVDEAIALYRKALAVKPDHANAHCNLGNALREKKLIGEAIAAYRNAIAINPDLVEAHSNLGDLLADKGQVAQGIAACQRAIAIRPDFASAYNNLGNILRANGRLDEALTAYRHAIALAPADAKTRSNFAVALRGKGRHDEGIAVLREAIALSPDSPDAYNNLGVALRDKGKIDEAIDAYRKAVAPNPKFAEAHSNLIFTLHYHPHISADDIAHEHRLWNQQHALPLAQSIRPHTHNRDPERRLRIGYASPDLREHAVSHFLLPLMANHDRQQFEIFAYAQVRLPDAMTQRLRAHTDGWHSLIGLTDLQAAEQIRQDQIDILIDLAGHTADHRLLVFAQKPAPVQMTYLGYPDTTGMDAIDYRLTDAYADPPGQTEQYHTEQLLRLSPCAWCFAPNTDAQLPPRHRKQITFGCFNTFAKVTQPMLEIWSQILHALPGSRLLLKNAGLGSASLREEVAKRMNDLGIASDRLDLRGQERDYNAHLALYGQMDIALDTFPYHGTTTTCEAMWMSVPVITLAGRTHVSRVGVSLLTAVGLPELIADTPERYEKLAVDLATDPSRLDDLHSSLRERMQKSPLMDGPRFARNVEAAYRQAWRSWCAAAR
jgi:predicted O-linked N-acetylglucosamine transferase (SPINDLY family)